MICFHSSDYPVNILIFRRSYLCRPSRCTKYTEYIIFKSLVETLFLHEGGRGGGHRGIMSDHFSKLVFKYFFQIFKIVFRQVWGKVRGHKGYYDGAFGQIIFQPSFHSTSFVRETISLYCLLHYPPTCATEE